MKRRGFNQREAGEYLGFGETYMSQLLSGARSPLLANALTIEKKTGIVVDSWVSEVDESKTSTVVDGRKRLA